MKTRFVVPDELDPIERHPKAPAPGEPMPPHNALCFGCGPESLQGLRLQMIAGEDFEMSASMLVEERFEGGPGVIHGGVLTSAFDDVLGMLPRLVGPTAVTGHLEVDFLAPIPIGKTLEFRAKLLGRQRRKLYAEGLAFIEDPDKPLAIAHAVFVTIDARAHFADHMAASRLPDYQKKRLEPKES